MATIPGDLKPGLLVHGRYRIQKQLGRGGMGVVYKAHDTALDEVVAIKILRPEFSAEPSMAERFKSEIKLARKVLNRGLHEKGVSKATASGLPGRLHRRLLERLCVGVDADEEFVRMLPRGPRYKATVPGPQIDHDPFAGKGQ